MADGEAPKKRGKKRGKKRSGKKRTAKRSSKKRTAKRTAKRSGGKLAGRVARLEKRVDAHSKTLRHHGSFIGAIVNGVRRAVGQKPLKDPLGKPAAVALPQSDFRKLASGR